jgi:hypothetical protein
MSNTLPLQNKILKAHCILWRRTVNVTTTLAKQNKAEVNTFQILSFCCRVTQPLCVNLSFKSHVCTHAAAKVKHARGGKCDRNNATHTQYTHV